MAADRLIRDLSQLIGLDDLDAIIELWVLDLRLLDPTQPLFYFSNWSQEDGVGAMFGGIEYVPMPVRAQGFEINSSSAPSEPTLTVSNVGLTWTGLINRWDDLIGCKLIRRRVLRRYLDDGATPSVTGAWPDEPWFIEQKQSENKMMVTFALSTAFALDDVKLPKRLALRYTCSWTYRGEGCGYNGPPVADAKDRPLPAPLHPDVAAYYEAVRLFRVQENAIGWHYQNVQNAEVAYNNSRADSWEFDDEQFHLNFPYSYVYTPPGFGEMGWSPWSVPVAFYGGVPVTVGDEWRAGADTGDGGLYYRPIQRWRFVQGTRDAALANLNAARAALLMAQQNYSSAHYVAGQARIKAGAVRDPRDQCSKTLTGCRLRWTDTFSGGNGVLPASMFPGLQIG